MAEPYDRAMVLVATLLLVGIALILIEFILPGMIAGILGFGCLIAAVAAGYVKFGAATGHFVLIGVLLGLMIVAVVWVKYFPHSRLGRVFVLQGHVGDAGFAYHDMLNQSGVTRSPLGPSGVAVINGRRCDVVSEGSFIEAGVPVIVVTVEGNRIVVRPATENDVNGA